MQMMDLTVMFVFATSGAGGDVWVGSWIACGGERSSNISLPAGMVPHIALVAPYISKREARNESNAQRGADAVYDAAGAGGRCRRLEQTQRLNSYSIVD